MSKFIEKFSSDLLEPCSCFPIWDLVCGGILVSKRGVRNQREEECMDGGGGILNRETRQVWFELRVGGFAVPRTPTAVSESAMARAVSPSSGEREMTTGKASEWLTRTVTFGARWVVTASKCSTTYLICKH